MTGGLIGSVREGSLKMTSCNSAGVTISNGVIAGGLVAYVNSCVVTIDGGGGTFIFNDISTKESGGNWNNNESIAGLVGTVAGNSIVNISSINITGNSISANGDSVFAGGAIGCCATNNGNDYKIYVDNVTLSDVDFNTTGASVTKKIYSGGLIGVIKNTVKEVTITNSCVKCTGDKKTINGYTMSGGLIGVTGANLTTLDSCSVENYMLTSFRDNTDSDGIGTLLAKAEFNTLVLKNCKASNCVLQAYKTKKPIGRVVGSAVSGVKFYGYNIALDNVQLQLVENGKVVDTTSEYLGDIVGELKTNAPTVNLVGVCMTMANGAKYVGKNAGKIADSGSIRVIFSDYNGTCLKATPNSTLSEVNNDNNVADMGAAPYATVNPPAKIGYISDTLFLTGDGAVSTAATIIDDVNQNKALSYKNISDDVTTFSGYKSKMSTFKKQFPNHSAMTDDFPVLVINELDYRKITEMLNSYIHILTNDVSIANYAADNSSFNIVMTPYRLDGDNKFIPQETATLKREGGYFKMTDMDYDSSHEQFTLIDIQYYAPNEPSKVAYHLYIPVYVEKMLNFDFKIGVLSGTTYRADSYTNGEPVMENYGTPVTSHITYSYLRTAEEWANAINSGENMLKAYGKFVTIKDNVFPDDTQLVLVDKNDSNKAYYSSFALAKKYNALEDKYYLYFNKFTSSDGAAFEPVPFIDMVSKSANIEAVQDNDKGTLAECSADDTNATVKIGEQYYRLATSSDSEKYIINVTPNVGESTDILNVDEEYYISFFTKESDADMMKIEIGCSLRLDDDGMIPSHMNNSSKKESSAFVILGNLYKQTFTFTTQSDNGSMVIDEGNNKIAATLNTTISLKAETKEEKEEVQTYLGSELIHLYHGFVIEAANNDGSGNGIKGAPQVTGTYTVSSTSYKQNIYNDRASIVLCGNVNDTLVDIKGPLSKGDSVDISCDVIIEYPDDASIIAQFPQRKSDSENYCTTYSASSNLAYTVDNIEHSSMFAAAADQNNGKYYREKIAAATLSYNIPSFTPNDMTMLGINGRESNDRIDAIAYYNVQNISEVDMNNAEHIRFTLSLYRKDNNGVYNKVDMDKHLEHVRLYYRGLENDKGYGSSDGDGAYTFTIEKSKLPLTDGLYEVKTSFDVITGDQFEDPAENAGAAQPFHGIYANYKVMLTAELLDANNNPIANTDCFDYIIYTNAKICTEMVA